MAGKQMHSGPTADTVRANVAKFRKAQGLSYAELSRELDRRGHPIPPLGLRRIEAGERRVDVDDLTALALALDVTPHSLLFPRVVGPEIRARVTGGDEVPSRRIWDWGRGANGYGTSDPVNYDGAYPLRILEDDERADIREAWLDVNIANLEERRGEYLKALAEAGIHTEVWGTNSLIAELRALDPADDEAWAKRSDDPAPPSATPTPGWLSFAQMLLVRPNA